jgi:geranylgeranyl pyrophosphate synthase
MIHRASSLETVPLLADALEREARLRPGVLPRELVVPQRLLDRALFEPLSKASRRPGKEFRARLSGICWELGGGEGAAPRELGLIVEALHLGSLIVDDIEDESECRRGVPCLHQQVGLPLALNAGNWLYFWPGAVLSRAGFDAPVELELRRAIDRAVLRCHYGQALDLSVRVGELRQREVRDVVFATTRLKTGSLMELAAELGATAARAEPESLSVLAELGAELGVALQMLDDLTGICVERRRDKGREDLVLGRPTWVWAWLAEQCDRLSYLRFRSVLEAVQRAELDPLLLAAQLAEQIGEVGRAAIRKRLNDALRRVTLRFAGSPALGELEREFERLEAYGG